MPRRRRGGRASRSADDQAAFAGWPASQTKLTFRPRTIPGDAAASRRGPSSEKHQRSAGADRGQPIELQTALSVDDPRRGMRRVDSPRVVLRIIAFHISWRAVIADRDRIARARDDDLFLGSRKCCQADERERRRSRRRSRHLVAVRLAWKM